MIAMIFEYWIDAETAGVEEHYAATSTGLRRVLEGSAGFAGVERFESCAEPNKYLAVGFFDDEAAVRRWRNHPAHRRAQQLGRDRYFTDYRLRMAEVVRDYGPDARAEAPADSSIHHGRA